MQGVAIAVSNKIASSIMSYEEISERIITVRFVANQVKISMIVVYAPTGDADECEKDTFYEQLQCTTNCQNTM